MRTADGADPSVVARLVHSYLHRRRFQAVAATSWFYRSAGISQSSVFLGRVFKRVTSGDVVYRIPPIQTARLHQARKTPDGASLRRYPAESGWIPLRGATRVSRDVGQGENARTARSPSRGPQLSSLTTPWPWVVCSHSWPVQVERRVYASRCRLRRSHVLQDRCSFAFAADLSRDHR